MTIRLRCAECHRKLKVVDEALGKKIQCPACGARFIGRIESSSPPPVNETPPTAQAQSAAVEAASNETPLLDALFAEMGTTSPLTMEESGIAREVSLPPPPPAVPKLAPPSPLNLELDEPPMEAAEALEPEVVEEEEVPIIEEAIEEEPPLLDAAEEEPPFLDGAEPAAEEVEVTEEADLEEEEDQPRKKRGLRFGRLAGIGLVMLLVCAGLGFLVYRFYSDSISDALLIGCLAGIGLGMLLDIALRLPGRNRSGRKRPASIRRA